MEDLSVKLNRKPERSLRVVDKAESHTLSSSESLERQLLLASQAGDQHAFEGLCKLHIPAMERRIFNIVKNQEDTEDALQETLLRVYMHLPSFRRSCKFSTWMTRIAINSALMVLRKRKTRIGTNAETLNIENGSFEIRDCADDAPNPEQECRSRQIAVLLHKGVEKLRPGLRRAVYECYVQDCSIREAADVLGISTAATKSRLMRSRVLLRSYLARYGHQQL